MSLVSSCSLGRFAAAYEFTGRFSFSICNSGRARAVDIGSATTCSPLPTLLSAYPMRLRPDPFGPRSMRWLRDSLINDPSPGVLAMLWIHS